MTDTDVICIVGLYIKGDQLDPDVASQVLGTIPTKARRKGERGVSKDGVERNYVQRTGIWALVIEKNSDVSECLRDLSARLGGRTLEIRQIPHADECYIDILLSLRLTSQDDNTYSFGLSEKDVATLYGLKLPVRCTVSFVRD
jgi:hypothetical protein